MTYRAQYIEQLELENRDLVGEMFDCKPFSDKWMRLRSELRANTEEIEIMKKLEGANNE